MSGKNVIVIENAELLFRNFRGKPSPFAPEGTRDFAVKLDPQTAEELLALDMNVKFREPRDEDDGDEADQEPKQAYLPIAAEFRKGRPPKITLLNSDTPPGGGTLLDEDDVGQLDLVDIVHVDLTVNPYPWSNATGASGVKAYLQTMFVTIEEDPLEKKYRQRAEQAAANQAAQQ